jgi:hypothetical protein
MVLWCSWLRQQKLEILQIIEIVQPASTNLTVEKLNRPIIISELVTVHSP